MQQYKLQNIALNVIKSNIYLTLATVDEKPWVAPLYYCVDGSLNFYFISQMDSRHTNHILKDPTVAFAIFDSHQEEGKGNGVQGSGRVHLVEKPTDITEGLQYYKTTLIDLKLENLVSPALYRGRFAFEAEHL